MGYGANWDPFKSVDGATISTAGGLEGYGETMAKALEQVLNDRKPAGLDPSQSLKENMGGAADSIFNKGQQNPSGKYKEQYQAGVSGGIAESHGKTVGEQTSILGSESVNIHTEGTTHVAGAIIAALNDNLKLDTGSLSYENLIGKTTSTSTSAGVNWTYSPEQKKDGKRENSKGEAQGGSSKNKKANSKTGQPSKTEYKKSESEQSIPKNDKYKNLPDWMGSIFAVGDSAKEWWGAKQKEIMFSPGTLTHTEKERIQTAYATIGKGEIIVRDNPGQSLDGLNRDLSKAMKTEQTTDVNIELKPAFSYVNDALSGWGWPANISGVFNFFNDPKAFLNGLQDKLADSIPLLKRASPKVYPTLPAVNTSPREPSTSGPQAAAQD